MNRVALLVILLVQLMSAQEIYSDRIMGLRVNGTAQAQLPVVDFLSQAITVEFDVNESEPPDLHIRVLHCDRNWVITNNGFVNDEMQNRSKVPLHYDQAPNGVRTYRFHYTVRIPGITGIDRFTYSGNYIFRITDERWETVLAAGRFFVVERVLPLGVRIANRSLPSAVNPYDQVNKIEVGCTIQRPEENNGETFFPLLLKRADIYKNRQLYDPWGIDADDQNPNTFVDGFGTSSLKFVVDNVAPGNSYRRLDVRDVSAYPEDRMLKAAMGADVSRFQMPPGSDSHGTSSVVNGSRFADYLPFRFELASEDARWPEVYVVGDFTGWRPEKQWLMAYDEVTKRYFCEASLRRGIYDYQYVVRPNDWIAVEGNDWRTSNVYSVFVYYHENRLGGYDRIVGFTQKISAGGKEPTSQ